MSNSIYKITAIVLVALCGVFLASNIFAAQYETITKLEDVAKNFLVKTITDNPEESIKIDIASNMVSSQLPECSKVIEPALPKDTNKNQITSVELTCTGQEAWHTFVPVVVHYNKKVMVAKHVIPAKTLISEDDVDVAEVDINTLYNGSYKSITEVIGMETAQSMPVGAVFNKINLRLPVIVYRDKPIDLIARKNAIQVTVKGIAKTDGRLNEMIKAYNPSSKQTIDVLVVGPSQVEVVS